MRLADAFRLAALVGTLAGSPATGLAQYAGPFQTVMLGGANLSCPVGNVFVSVYATPHLLDIAKSSIVGGVPVIVINTAGLGAPAPVQWFFFGHECAHHRLGHLIGNYTMTSEVDADCYSVQRLRQIGLLDQADVNIIAQYLFPNPAFPPLYPAGPVRAQNILNCFAATPPAQGP